HRKGQRARFCSGESDEEGAAKGTGASSVVEVSQGASSSFKVAVATRVLADASATGSWAGTASSGATAGSVGSTSGLLSASSSASARCWAAAGWLRLSSTAALSTAAPRVEGPRFERQDERASRGAVIDDVMSVRSLRAG